MEEEKISQVATVEAVLGGKWFWPILCQLEEIENALSELIPLLEPALKADAPDWSFRGVVDIVFSDSKVNGMCDARQMNARDVGRIVGAKVALCDVYARAYPVFKSFTPAQVKQFEEAWRQTDLVSECIEFSREFAEDLNPRMREIKKAAVNLAAEQGLKEEVDYLQGFSQGTKSTVVILARMRPPKNRRERESRARNCVYLFVATFGAEIEESKGELSWPGLHELFMKFVENGIDMDEETFKKILLRKGLKGVGKVGRPVPEKKFRVRRKLVVSDPAAE